MASLIKRTWKNGPAWYIQYYVGNQQRRIRASDNFQIAKEKLRRFDAAQAAGDDLPLPTRTLIPEIVAAYVQHIRQVKTAKSAQTDIYYLRDMFGPVCDELKINSRKPSAKAKKKPVKAGVNARTKTPVIERRDDRGDCKEEEYDLDNVLEERDRPGQPRDLVHERLRRRVR